MCYLYSISCFIRVNSINGFIPLISYFTRETHALVESADVLIGWNFKCGSIEHRVKN